MSTAGRLACYSLIALSSMHGEGRNYGRSMVIARQGIAATSQALASQTGAQILARGGSAELPITPRPPMHPLRLADLAGLAEVAEADAREGREPH